jgi:uncharacterized protein
VTELSPRIALRRHPERGVYERETINAILDEALCCHVGFVVDGQPFVIPMIHARVGDLLYLHGSPASRLLRELGGDVDACVTATLLDGIVLARAVYNHSLNYRCAVVLGRARSVDKREEKLAALAAIVEHVVVGRSRDARPPNAKELAATKVLALPLDEASAKVRSGPPKDFDDDVELPIWAGVIPLRTAADKPLTEERVPESVTVPAYASDYRRLADGGTARTQAFAGERTPAGLVGRCLPDLRLATASGGEAALAEAGAGILVLYVYPRTAVPGQPLPAGWDEIPGARGCTAENRAFRDLESDLREEGAWVMGVSAQPLDEQRAFAAREGITYPLLNDAALELADTLRLPTFQVAGMTLYRRLTLIVVERRIEKVLYRELAPELHPIAALDWLRQRRAK